MVIINTTHPPRRDWIGNVRDDRSGRSSLPGRVTAALALLIVAALGGLFLVSFHLRENCT